MCTSYLNRIFYFWAGLPHMFHNNIQNTKVFNIFDILKKETYLYVNLTENFRTELPTIRTYEKCVHLY